MYREMTIKTKTTGPYQGVANPRNTGQIRNVTKTVRKKNRISHDQLYNVIQLGYHLQDFLKLVYKHVMFQRGNIIPVAFMIHDRRSGELHDRFFQDY